MDQEKIEKLKNKTIKIKKRKEDHKTILSLIGFYEKSSEKDNLNETIHELQEEKETLSEEISKLNQNKEEINQNLTILKQENISHKELNKEVNDLQKQKESFLPQVNNLTQEVTELTQRKSEIEEALDPLREEKEKLIDQNEKAKEENSLLNRENTRLRDEISEQSEELRKLRSETTRLKEEKTLYSETLSGHREETNKMFLVNMAIVILALVFFSCFSFYVFNFYENAIKHMIDLDDNYKALLLLLGRGGAGILFYFIINFFLNVTHTALLKMYSIFEGVRDIESRLILAREITFSTEKDIPFENDEQKRKYLSYLKGKAVKDYFLYNLDSLKKEIISTTKLNTVEDKEQVTQGT